MLHLLADQNDEENFKAFLRLGASPNVMDSVRHVHAHPYRHMRMANLQNELLFARCVAYQRQSLTAFIKDEKYRFPDNSSGHFIPSE